MTTFARSVGIRRPAPPRKRPFPRQTPPRHANPTRPPDQDEAAFAVDPLLLDDALDEDVDSLLVEAGVEDGADSVFVEVESLDDSLDEAAAAPSLPGTLLAPDRLSVR